MTILPLVVLNWALKVSGAVAVSLLGSAKPGEAGAAGAGAALVVVSSALAATTAAKRLNAQSKLVAFMDAKFSIPQGKSHARNQIIFGVAAGDRPAWNW